MLIPWSVSSAVPTPFPCFPVACRFPPPSVVAARPQVPVRAAAGAAARGESAAVVRSTALRVAGEDAAIRLGGNAGTATVTVTGPAPGILGTWGGWELRADASAETEGAGAADGHGG